MPNEISRRRQRLPAEVRIQHILDAALSEFSRHGYGSARMEDIAQAAGLSKGGLYAHFPSKESLLKTLLANVIEVPLQDSLGWWPEGIQTLEELVSAFVDHTLQRLTDPAVLPTIRLLLAEAPRLPPDMQDWHQKLMATHEANHKRMLERAVCEGLMPHNPTPLEGSVLVVPVMYSLFRILASGAPLTSAEIETLRPLHHSLLLRLLRP